MITAKPYPLTWPLSVARTDPAVRGHSRFGRRRRGKYGYVSTQPLTVADARSGLLEELERFGAHDVILSSNVPLRLDGLPASNRKTPDDPGVAVFFTRDGRHTAIACDQYKSPADNMRALAVTIDSLRRIERHGSSNLFDQAFSGFEALAPSASASESWWDTLGVGPDATLADCESAYRERVVIHHPDKPEGSSETMIELNAAIDAARAYFSSLGEACEGRR